MAHSRKGSISGADGLGDRFKNSLRCNEPEIDKPDFRELDLGSPVSPLLFRRRGTSSSTATTTSSSSSSSGSVSGRNGSNPVQKRSDLNHSGELSGSVDSSPTARGSKPGYAKSDSGGSHPLIYSGASSPALNTLPAGNICPSGRVLTTGMANRATKNDVLGSGTGNYGHGSIMRGGGVHKSSGASSTGLPTNSKGFVVGETVKGGMRNDPEELKLMGNEHYKKGQYAEALNLYEKAIAISPRNAAYHCNRAAALIALKRVDEALRECEEAIRLDQGYVRAHHRLGSLFLSLGQVENARRHMCLAGHQPDHVEVTKLERVEKHIGKCNDARRLGDWRSMLREADAAIASGADASPQLFACRAEALLKLSQLDDADSSLSNVPQIKPTTASYAQSKIFGMLSEAYLLFVRAQVELALGRFGNALSAIEKAGQIDSRNIEVSLLLSNVRLVSQARIRGNDLFKSERYTEACAAYGDGLRLDPSNSVLYCNRAACWYKLGQWEKSVGDCNQALHIQPKYTKALLRRAASNMKLELWAEAVRDYEVLRRELPHDNEVAESLLHARGALKKSRGEEVHNSKYGGEIEIVSGLEQFRAAILSPGVSVVHFKAASNVQCWEISAFLDTLCSKYRSINFLKVDVEDCPVLANAENVRIVPTFKIYKKGERVKDLVCPSPEELESLPSFPHASRAQPQFSGIIQELFVVPTT
nr:TPR repeat-containing thioredoxin TTL1 [Ipomoea batatas]